MWWIWPHCKRLWAAAGAITLGLFVNYLFALMGKQSVPTLHDVTSSLYGYWYLTGGFLTLFAIVSLVARRAYQRHAAQAPRPLRTAHGPLHRLFSHLPMVFRSSPGPGSARAYALPGRTAELAQLGQWWAQVRAGSRRVVFVTGAPGVGKTTLITAFLDSVAGHRAWIARGQCVEQHGAVEPYMPVLDAVTRLCREPGNDRLVEILHRLAPTWLAQMPSLVSVEDRMRLHGQLPGHAPDTTHNRMLREMVEACEAMAADRPLILLLEDLQWSDPSTLDLLAALARRTEPAQLLILATHRPVATLSHDHPLRALQEDLGRHRQCAELALEPLSEDALAAYRADRLADAELPSARVALAPPAVDAKRLALAAGAGALALGATIYALTNWRPSAPKVAGQPVAPSRVIRSIAVLPLDNYSGDPNQEYFADGMTDELTTDLASISALRVISRGSVMQFKGERRPPTPTIAKLLNVDAVVEGSVLRIGDKVRITAQLIDAPADKHLWAKSYERDSRDVLAMQDEVASAIAREINVQLTPNEQARLTSAPSVNPAAHDAYLQGRYFFDRPSDENLSKAIARFKEAIRLDPNFAPAYSGLSDAYLWAGYNEGVLSDAEAMPLAQATAERAVQLDENSAEAHTSLANFKMFYEFDWAGAETEFRRAFALNPNYAFAHDQFGLGLAFQGRLDEAAVEGRRAVELDPLSPQIALDLAVTLMWQGKYEAAIEQTRRALDLDPAYFASQWALGWINIQAGKINEAVPELEKANAMGSPPFVAAWLGYAYGASGDRAKASGMIEQLKRKPLRGYVAPFNLAIVYLGMGDRERALDGLEKAYTAKSQSLASYLKMDRIFVPLHAEPRYRALLKRMNLDN